MEILPYDFSSIALIDFIAIFVFVLCIFLSIYLRNRARGISRITGKKIRSIYRKNWVERMLAENNFEIIINIVRNQIMVSVALLSAIVISFGFILSLSGFLNFDGNMLLSFKIFTILSLVVYAFFMILLETRMLVYIPVVFSVNADLIKKYENMKKEEYVAKLLHESFDHFSNAIRAIVFIISLVAWLYNSYLFIIILLFFTAIMIKDDYGEHSAVTLF